MGGVTGCKLAVSEATPDVIRTLGSRLGVSVLFLSGEMTVPALRGKAPAASPDGRTPGLRLGQDDSALRAALDAAGAAGLSTHLVMSNPLAGAAKWHDLLAHDNGGRSAADTDREGPTLCPNRPKLLKWLGTAAEELLRTYKPAGLLLDDFSLGSPDKIDTLFQCWCEVCQTRAADLGYDADRIRVGLQGARSKVAADAPHTAADLEELGLGQFLEAVGYDTGVLDWVNFRADSVSACVFEVRQALNKFDPGLQVTALCKGPTVSLLAGQRRADCLRDTTLVHVYAPVICGARSGVLATIASHARVIRGRLRHSTSSCRPESVEGRDDGDARALAFSARLHGCGRLPLPASAEQMVRSPDPRLLIASAERELALTLGSSGEAARWPAIDVHGLPAEVVEQAARLVTQSHAEGLLYVGVPG